MNENTIAIIGGAGFVGTTQFSSSIESSSFKPPVSLE